MWPRVWPPQNCSAHLRGGIFLLATNLALALLGRLTIASPTRADGFLRWPLTHTWP